jgi:hypothetical protein
MPRGTEVNKWLEWMHSDEYAELAEAEEKALAEHWANDLLDAPHALIAVIETKIARAEIQAEKRTEERIIKNIKSRISDLRACSKQDNCQEFASLIETYIPEWIEGEQK